MSRTRPARDHRQQAADEPGTLRLFFAVPVPAEARARVGELIDRVQGSVGDGTARIRWVRVEGLHLTLRFLGPTPADRRAYFEDAADAVAGSATPFEVGLSGGGAFPSLARPRSLWIGVSAGSDRLAALAEGLTRAAEGAGTALDTRPFAAHLTIGRTDGVRLGPAVAQALRDAASELDVRFRADRLILFRSHLGGGPARYEPLHEAHLGSGD
jgi:2'-5' RNA ligase